MSSTRQVLDDWYQRVKVTQITHYRSAEHFGKRKYWLGVPAVLISTIVGTTVFASLQTQPELWLKIIVGLASVAAAILTSLQTFLGYSERAEKHRLAGAKYGALGRELEVLRSLPEVDLKTINDLRTRLDALAQESPNNPIPIYSKAWKEEAQSVRYLTEPKID